MKNRTVTNNILKQIAPFRPALTLRLRIVIMCAAMFEHRHEPLLPKALFVRRVIRHLGIGAIIIAGSLGVGILGYHVCEELDWLDSLLNASMILSGMGPVNPIQHTAGKWFASFYALFSGVAFITSVGVLFAPLVHRFMHKFHLESDGER